MTINLDSTVTPAVSDLVEHLTGPVVIHIGDFTLRITEEQAAELIDTLSAHLSDRGDRWELTEEGKAYIAACG